MKAVVQGAMKTVEVVAVDIQVVEEAVALGLAVDLEEMVAGKETGSCSLVAWIGVWTMITFVAYLKNVVLLTRPKLVLSK